MHAQKLSISLPKDQCNFLDTYQDAFHLKSRSDVIKEALYLLQQAYLERCYKEANEELNNDFDATLLDGIEEDETW